jgi:carbamoyl-phosphate synthase large subunit
MNKINILILGVGGNVSQGILKAVLMSKLNVRIVGACVDSESLGLYMCDSAYISPMANDEKFIPWLIDLCNKEEIQIIFSGVEEVLKVISKNYNSIQLQTKAICIFTPHEKLMIGQDKLATSDWLRENNCNYPLFCKSNDTETLNKLIHEVGFPLIAKPRKGKGSQGIVKITSHEELNQLNKLNDYVVQEYIGDENSEYTVGCYCDKNGQLIEIIIMHRDLKHGTTFKATVIDNDLIYNEAKKICERFKPVGPLNIQLRLNKNNIPVCFELNVRFSGTTPIRAYFGFNDVEAMIREYILNENIQNLFQIRKGTAYRYFEEMYIDDRMQEKLMVDKVVKDVSIFNNSAKGFSVK